MDNTKKTEIVREYTEEERRRLINNFFKVSHVELPSFLDSRMLLVYLGIFIGLVLMFYLKKALPTVIFCAVCFGFSFWQFYKVFTPYWYKKKIFSMRPNEDQINAWLVKDIKEIVKPKSITTLGLNMSDVRPENFIIIPIPIYWGAPGIDKSQVLRSPLSDGTFTYSVWRVQILVLTKHFISLFKCNYNWLDNSISSISTNEFYFQDITSIRNDMREIEFKFADDDERPIGGGKVFCVTNFSGEYLTVVNDIPSLQAPKIVSVNLEYIVSLLRMVIRNRRFGITHEEMSEHERQQVAPEPTDNEQVEDEAEKINSIERLLNKRDDELDQQESQFGDGLTSSFDDDAPVDVAES